MSAVKEALQLWRTMVGKRAEGQAQCMSPKRADNVAQPGKSPESPRMGGSAVRCVVVELVFSHFRYKMKTLFMCTSSVVGYNVV